MISCMLLFFMLTVPPAVTFVGLQPSYQLGSTVTLTCTATGFPEVSIEFEVSGVSATVTKQTQTQASLHPPFTVSKVLTLERVTTSDCGGRISCTGTNMNRVGTHTSKVESTVQIRGEGSKYAWSHVVHIYVAYTYVINTIYIICGIYITYIYIIRTTNHWYVYCHVDLSVVNQSASALLHFKWCAINLNL